MIIRKATEMTHKPTLNFLVYGDPKIGKSTFAIKGGKVLIADCEAGYRFMGLNGLEGDIAEIQTWEDMGELYKIAKTGGYDVVVIDPINELLEKLMTKMKSPDRNGNINKRYALISGYDTTLDKNGKEVSRPLIELTMGGWGMIKSRFKEMLKKFRDANVNVLIVAHTKEDTHEDVTKKSPKLDANLSKDLMGMMDVIGYMRMATVNGEKQRIVQFESSETYDAGDRTGILPKFIDANIGFKGVYALISGNKKYKKSTEEDKPLKLSDEKQEDDSDVIERYMQKEEELEKEEQAEKKEQKVDAMKSNHDNLAKKQQIINHMKLNHPAIIKQKDREDEIVKMTGLEFTPENYDLIIEKLK